MRTAIASFEKNRELQLSSLRDAVRLAETSLELAKSGKTVSGSDDKRNIDALEIAVKVKEDAVLVAEENLRKAVAGGEMAQKEMVAKISETEAQSGEARAKRREAETGFALSNERANYSEIRAPFSGIVTER
ncbi:MAG: Efflux transporter, family, subunit, partial [Patescibacteria group bacterium]|nr:Efflux transporter, family, subunit [Patescibacteria group bacterium]